MAALLDAEKSVVVGIDFQGRLMELVYRHEELVGSVSRLYEIAGLFAVPIVMTEQYPKGLGPTAPALTEVLERVASSVETVEKGSFSCCGEPSFLRALDAARPPGDRQIVLSGIEAHICVVQTCLELCANGEQVYVAAECVTGRGQEARADSLARMAAAGAQVVSSESIAFEWARSKDHPQFKAVSGVLKGAPLP